MGRYARGAWSDEEILDALHGRNGTQEIRFRADILQDGAKAREAPLAPGGSITLDMTADILRIARFELYEPVNELTEEIKPYMLLRMEDAQTVSSIIIESWTRWDGLGLTWGEIEARGLAFTPLGLFVLDGSERVPQYAEFPLGVFIPSTPTRTSADGVSAWTVEAYDKTIVLKEDGLDTPLFLSEGAKYLDEVLSILARAGITNIMIASSVDTEIAADREFEVGKSLLEVVNTLLGEINFNPIFCDADGNFVIGAYEEPTAASADITYKADHLSIIGRDTSTETDYYKVPNVFIAACSNPDLKQDYRSTYINDNPISPFSTLRRGRRIISEIYRPDQIASQADLDVYIRRMAFERTLEASETVTFSTAPMPVHGRAEDVELQHPDASGVFREVGWTIRLDAGGEMEHVVKRTVIL